MKLLLLFLVLMFCCGCVVTRIYKIENNNGIAQVTETTVVDMKGNGE